MILRPAENRRDAPLWLNWKPVTVDFSPWRENQMVMAKMSAEAIERSSAARQKAKDLKVPDFSEALPHDAAWAYNDAIAAKQGLENMLMQGNPQAIMKTPEFAKAYRAYAESVSPARISKLKMEKKAHDDFDTRLGKLGEEAAGLLYYDRNGLPINSPGGGLQNAAELHMLRRDHEGYAINNAGESIDFRTGVLGSVNEFKKHLGDRFAQAGVTKDKFDNAKGLANLVNAAADQPDAALLATIKQSVERGGNASQLTSAVQSSLKTMGPEQTAAIIQAYTGTRDYQDRADADVSEGGFRVNGAISPGLVWKAAFTEPKYATALKLSDKKQKVYFATAFVVEEAARFLSESNLISSDLVTLKGRQPTAGGDGNEKGLVNLMAHLQNIGAGMKYNPYTGAQEPIGRPQKFTVVHDKRNQYGDVVGKDAREVDSYVQTLPKNVVRGLEREVGVLDKEWNRKPVEDLPEMSQVFPGAEFRIANGGARHSTNDIQQGVKVQAIYPEAVMLPDNIEELQERMSYGEEDWQSFRAGGMSPYWVVEVRTTDDIDVPLTDYMKGLDGIEKVSIDSEQYAGAYPKGTKDTDAFLGGFNFTGPNSKVVKVYVRAGEGDMLRRGEWLMNPEELKYLSDPAIRDPAKDENYQASLKRAGYTGPVGAPGQVIRSYQAHLPSYSVLSPDSTGHDWNMDVR
jgi:hypothetical protein